MTNAASILPGLIVRHVDTARGRLAWVSLNDYADQNGIDLEKLPRSLRIILEAGLCAVARGELDAKVVQGAGAWRPNLPQPIDLTFPVSRVLLQDAAGLPLLADLAALRDAAAKAGQDPASVQSVIPFALVVDHSVQLDHSGTKDSLRLNLDRELERNGERYGFLKWAAQAFDGLTLVPPGNGIIHQVHLEQIAEIVCVRDGWISADTVIGSDSHTTMINGLGVLGWGVGGIEAEGALLGDPLTVAAPDIIGVTLTGRSRPGVLATDLVLALTKTLRDLRVTGAFIEFHGPGLKALSVEDRATLANMAPEYGATLALFPVDEDVLSYLRATGRTEAHVSLVREHLQRQSLFGDKGFDAISYNRRIDFDLSAVGPSVAGPTRPDQLVALEDVASSFAKQFPLPTAVPAPTPALAHGQIVLAAITSCTNTANPGAMVVAGLLAEAAVKRGLLAAAGIKTSFAPGSRSVPAYLAQLGLLEPLAALGFHVDAFGCAACVGNSGALSPVIESALAGDAVGVAVLSGNRNFEARIHPKIRAAYLMSPALVVAYALAGRIDIDWATEPVGWDRKGIAVPLNDIWPTVADVAAALARMPQKRPQPASYMPAGWEALAIQEGPRFVWQEGSTFLRPPPFFEHRAEAFAAMTGARLLLVLGDDITTDHISPVGAILPQTPAASYLAAQGVGQADFGSYAARRVNHEVMLRGTFANPRLRNALVSDRAGPVSRHMPSGEIGDLVDIAARYGKEGKPIVIIAGKNYGTGSARDWAAKGTALLGIRAVIARSFERIHRSNLVRLGIAPLELFEDIDLVALMAGALDVTIDIKPTQPIGIGSHCEIRLHVDHRDVLLNTCLRADTEIEVALLQSGGVFAFFLEHKLGIPARAFVDSSSIGSYSV